MIDNNGTVLQVATFSQIISQVEMLEQRGYLVLINCSIEGSLKGYRDSLSFTTVADSRVPFFTLRNVNEVYTLALPYTPDLTFYSSNESFAKDLTGQMMSILFEYCLVWKSGQSECRILYTSLMHVYTCTYLYNLRGIII